MALPRIAIDAGHYFYTSGKRCLASIDPTETREWVLNSRVASMLVARLADYDCEVMRVDDVTGETEVTLPERCWEANHWGADLYLSIHHNAGIGGGSGGGTVVFYYSPDPKREEQAEKLYADVVSETGLKGNRADGVVYKNYYVLRNTKCPSFLLENGFMDSQTDTPIILTPEHAEATAKGLEKFVVEMFNLKKKEDEDMFSYEDFKKYMDAYMKELEAKDPAKWSADDRRWAEENGIIKGDANGNKMYEAPITREQSIAILRRGLKVFSDAIDKAMK